VISGRRRVALALGGLALGAGLALPACRVRPLRFTNLVVIVVDTLRSDHLPGYGYERETAPVLRRLASEGVQLQGYAASSWTKPSVATLLTGLLPQRHQTISLNDRLPEEAPYLPAILSARGFTSLAFIGNAANLGRKQGFGRGFEVAKQWMGPPKIHAGEVNRRAFEILPRAKAPYFLWIHYVDPHDPYKPPAPWPGSALAEEVQPGWFGDGSMPTPAQLQRLKDQYDGEVVEVDQGIGALVGELKQRGLLERTLVVVTADHGEEFAEHGWLMHGHSLHEELVRVPFVLWAERGLRPLHSDTPFALVDFVPTALEALGVEAPAGLDGVSRWPALAEGRAPESAPILFHLDRQEGAGVALLETPFKIIERAEEPSDLLYDLAADPAETRPLDGALPRLRAMRDRLFAAHNRAARIALPRSGRGIDGELRSELAGLGYLRGGADARTLSGRRIPSRLDPEKNLAAQVAPPD
jgi:arylsulfatase